MLSFFGGDKEKARLLNASRNLYDCVYMFVSSSNTIFRMFNQFLKTELPVITVRENLSIKENFQLLTSALREMQEFVESKDKEVQQKISLPLYSKIATPGLSMNDKIRLLKDIYVQYKGVFDNICGPISVVVMKHGNLPEILETAVRDLSSSPVLSVRVGDLLMTHEEIAKALPDFSPTSSSAAAPPEPRPRSRSMSIGGTTFSFTNFIRITLRGQSSKKNAFEAAADCLEEAVKILKPYCESFQRTVKTVEEYVTLIIDKLQ
ncbi:uncharacterized protein C12orf60 homolog [Sceloporus undulatus]|uniref:uncharacterized protein C12orf60 homolog n=1 Tax=Sceloporus undulatus TaxID=8520 RepID=UPI001C4BD1A7|nr:uncharacterized protein C12orf60 homolog [Sceloporus undulatus]